MTNPETAIKIITDTEETIPLADGTSITVYPLTLGRFALLDQIGSPLMTGNENLQKTLETVYVMTTPLEVLLKGGKSEDAFREKALIWADNYSNIEALNQIVEKIRDKMNLLDKTCPSDASEDGSKKKVTTD